MASRVWTRATILSRALFHLALSAGRRKRPVNPRRVLVAHHLLLGDTLMLTPLLAKLRERFPNAEIIMTAPKAIAPLYDKRPYGVTVWPFDARDPGTVAAMYPSSGFDLAIVPGDNRYAWLAAALGARWIVAHAGDKPAYKNWPVDELISYSAMPKAWGDMVAELIDGPAPAPYQPADWPAPSFLSFDLPTNPYAVLHVGASTPLRLWEPVKWRILAEQLVSRGLTVVWSAGKGESRLVEEIDPEHRYASFAGRLDLPQLWHLLTNAALFICPDTGVAHLARITNTPTVTLFGPGSTVLFGTGDFWRNSPYHCVTIDDFPCRDERVLFKREIEWVRRCRRSLAECPAPACMQAVRVDSVFDAACELVARIPREATGSISSGSAALDARPFALSGRQQ
ncbi:MAG: glycosyltransferase family 9 protein [Burkholderiales bacterium]|nr:glycosyltransferase family 9 protein [Burkholderiales bacterium]